MQRATFTAAAIIFTGSIGLAATLLSEHTEPHEALVVTPPVVPSPTANLASPLQPRTSFAGPVAQAAPSSAYTLAYADEFNDGQVSQADWYYRITGKYTEGYNRQQNVSETAGALRIRYGYEDVSGDGVADFTGGGVISRRLFGYGYYETRARLFSGSPGLHTSFWSMGILAGSPGIGSDPLIAQDIANGVFPENNQLYEIDGFEHDSPDWLDLGTVKQSANAKTRRNGGKNGATRGVNYAAWNVYGYDYQPTATRFYINGVLQFTIDNTVVDADGPEYQFTPANVWLTALAYKPNPTPGALPGYSEFDYFRYYRNSLPGVNRLGNAGFDAEKSSIGLWIPGGWIENYDKTAGAVVLEGALGTKRSLRHSATVPYLVTTKQNLTALPNGNYTLSAWVKSSGGQSEVKMRVLGYGATERSVLVPATPDWVQITIPTIAVTSGRATIAFTSNAAAGQWLMVDQVSFREQ